jgi:succinate dehydrogenase / fumarate reductase flavoprotein subunit
MEKVGIYREAGDMQAALEEVQQLRERYRSVRVQDTGRRFNTDLLELIELGNLLDLSLITAASALNRTESRGAHSREDFKVRDDDNWLKHTLAYLEGDSVRIDYKPVDTSIWQPKPRTY